MERTKTKNHKISHFAMHHLVFGINFLLHSVNLVLIIFLHSSHPTHVSSSLPSSPLLPSITLKPRSHRARQRASMHPIKPMLKIGSIHTDRIDARRRASTNLHTSNERCQFKLSHKRRASTRVDVTR